MKKIVALSAVLLLTVPVGQVLAGRYCEVVGFSPYEAVGTESMNGFMVQTIRRCATVTIRNTDDRSRYATDYDVIASFKDGERSSRRIDREEDRLKSIEPGRKYTASLCFRQSSSPIESLDCSY